MILMESLAGSGHTRVSFRPKPSGGSTPAGGALALSPTVAGSRKEMLAFDPLVGQICLYREKRKIRSMPRNKSQWD